MGRIVMAAPAAMRLYWTWSPPQKEEMRTVTVRALERVNRKAKKNGKMKGKGGDSIDSDRS